MTRRLRSYWSKYIQLYKRGILGIIAFIGITVVIISILFTIASRGMGVIFNEVISRQTMMRGTITVASLSATPWGGAQAGNGNSPAHHGLTRYYLIKNNTHASTRNSK